jgi:hypothetical protein
MIKAFKKILNEFHSLAWTLAGAVTVLITLSGETLTLGIWISAIALVIHLLGIIIKKED